MALIGYARVSTTDQHAEGQTDQLTAAGCDRVFVDHASGKLASRPELDKCLAYLRAGDTLVITKLDRLGRSVANLIELVGKLAEREIDLRVITQGIDTSTSGGKLTFHILASIAEFERDIIRERTLDGLTAARARGRVGGRKPKLSVKQVSNVQAQHAAGKTVTELAELFSVTRPTIYRVLESASAS